MRQAYLSPVLILLLVFHAEAGVKMGPIINHQGVCEPSGAVAFPEGSFAQRFVVAEDEHNVLRVYQADQGGESLDAPSGDLNKHLLLDPDNEDEKADFEAATWLNGKVYWIGSHSRSKKGKLREARWQFLSTTIQLNGPSIQISPNPSYHDLLVAFTALDPILANAIELDVKEKNSLAAEKEGLNIEGMTVGADARSILIGLRNPLSVDKKALLVSIQNPEAVVEMAAKPVLGKLVLLDLKGRGVRSIEYSPGAQTYFIVAGPINDSGAFELYRWSGAEQDEPIAVNGSADAFAAIADFHPEAMFIDPIGRQLHFLSDDGDRKLEGGLACKELSPSQRTFRSVVMTLDELN